MARFYGKVGYGSPVENPPESGIWIDQITEVSYFGDVLQDLRRLEPGENLIGNVSLNNRISIVADAYANEHFHAIRYVEWAGARWTVTSVEQKSPRLILSLGTLVNGDYIGPTP